MEAKIYVTSLTDHRIDVMLASWMRNALIANGLNPLYRHIDMLRETTSIFQGEEQHVFMFNGVLTEELQNTIDEVAKHATIWYFYDDLALEIPKNVNVVSQFYSMAKDSIYFPIAELAVFDDMWDCPLPNSSSYKYLHGGTYKPTRAEEYAKMHKHTLLLGDDIKWDTVPSKHRMPTIRDMDLYYNIQSMCEFNLLLLDEQYDKNCHTLRFFEGVFTNTGSRLNGMHFTANHLRQITNKNKVRAELCNMLRQMQIKF